MTLATAPARRAVIDLGADATILDAARQMAGTGSQDVVLSVPAGAPLARNAVFLEVLRRRAGARRLILVSPEARARSLAASVHIRAFSSLAALDRHELDATEQLTNARRTALATVAVKGARRPLSAGRALAVVASLLTATAILLAVIAPTATIVMSATTSPLGPYEYDLRAGPQGDIRAITRIDDKVTVKVGGTATDSRDARIKATGFERFTNLTTSDIRIPVGTVVWTSDNPPIRFQTTQEKILPKSSLFPLPTVSTVLIGIEALDFGPRGNVPSDRITNDSNPDYLVTNPSPTTGGEDKKIPVVKLADYELAVARADVDPRVKAEAEARVKQWKDRAAKNATVYGYTWTRTGASPASEVVGSEGNETFEITVTGTVTAYEVDSAEPKTTAIERLKAEIKGAAELDVRSAVVDPVIGPTVGADGVRWRVRARGQQFPTANRALMSSSLAGRSFDEVAPTARRFGFEVQSVTAWPSWWPRLPVLDSRITIQLAPAATSPP